MGLYWGSVQVALAQNDDAALQRTQRLDKAIDTAHERRVQAKKNRCELVTDRINRRVERMQLRTNRRTDHSLYRANRFARLEELGCDTTEIKTNFSQLEALVAEFVALRQEMTAHVQGWSGIVCSSDTFPGEAEIAAFRTTHQELVKAMQAKANEIRHFRLNTFQPSLFAFKAACLEKVDAARDN